MFYSITFLSFTPIYSTDSLHLRAPTDGDWHRDSLTLGTKAHQANAIPADDVMMLDSVDTIQTTDEVAKKLIEFLVTRSERSMGKRGKLFMKFYRSSYFFWGGGIFLSIIFLIL